MENLEATIAAGLRERYRRLAVRVRELAALLTEEQFWLRPFPFGHRFGHLVLHLAGKLNYYIGAPIAGTGYVRERDREFAEVRLNRFGDCLAPYSASGSGDVGDRFHLVLTCASHLDHPVGR
jgi:hypothetical protein